DVALCALLFRYRDVLQVELAYVEGILRAKRPSRVPVVFTRAEVSALMSHLSGTYSLIEGFFTGRAAPAGGGAAKGKGLGFRLHGDARARWQG
ncbi:MAG: hypothetical protein ACJ74T_02600, partial [Pyrinomonadaceae bacterium]